MRSFFLILKVSALILFFGAVAIAQETTGGIQGTVKDPSGAVVPGVKVVVAGSSLVGNKEAQTDSAGYYRFANLPPGTYTITVSAQGFKTFKREALTLEVGHLPTVDISLEVGTASAVVEVTSAAPVIDVTTTQNLTNVTNDVIENIPHGNSYQSMIQFAPMARNEPLAGMVGYNANMGGTGGSLPGSSSNGLSYGYSIGGAADSENGYLVEGQDTENISGGYSKANVPFQFIQEVQIKSSGIEAEYGGALGGVVNVVMKKGGNNWHGDLSVNYETSALDGSPDALLRYNPQPGTITPGFDNNSQLYQPKQDHFRNLQPGASVGGPIVKDRLWFFAAAAPFVSSRARTVDFSPSQLPENAALGPQYFTQDTQTYYTNARLDASLTRKVRVFGSWLNQYARQTGSNLPRADSPFGQYNEQINTPIAAYSHGIGWSAPNATYNVGADITLTPKIVATTRYGYFFENYHDFGWQRNTPNIVWNSNGLGAVDNQGNPLPASLQFSRGTSTAPYNGAFTLVNANKHYQFNQDVAFFKGGWWGTHNIKVGYQLNHLVNVINQNGNVPEAFLNVGNNQSWFPFTATGQAACGTPGSAGPPPVPPSGLAGEFGNCAGLYGYLYVQDFSTILTKPASDWNHALYAQDSWNVGHGLTFNLGVRVEKEYLPAPYNLPVAGFKTINFSWTDKVAPRLGFAWDPTRHGKMKIFGSYGVVNDVMKLLLAQTSWGAQSFEQCSYALGPNSSSTFNVSDINLIFVNNRACPNGLPTVGANFAGGTTPQSLIDKGTGISLIENINLRPWEPIAPGVKPYRQHEYVGGFDYQISKDLAFEARYDRRRLDHILEDSSLNDPFWGETYTVVNPGEGVNKTLDGYASFLTSLGQSFGVPGWAFNGAFDQAFGLSFGTCPTCPPMPKAVRNYDGLELRVTKTPTRGWSAMFSYTYSSLWGNYTGLTNTDQTDGGVPGRNSPDTSRAFDEPFYYFGANGKSNNGPLATDRPNTFKGYAYYRLPWAKHFTTSFGIFQAAYQGSPQASYIDIGNMFPNQVSEAVDVFGRDKWVNLTQDAAGHITVGTPYTRRAPWFTNTDFDIAHEIKVSESRTVSVQMNITNVLNQHAITSYYGGMNSTYFTRPLFPGVLASGASAYQTFETGYNVQQQFNAQNASAATQVIQSGLYGQPLTFQLPRGIRFMLRYTF